MRRRTIVLVAAALALGACAGKPLRITCSGFADQLEPLPPSAVVRDIATDHDWQGKKTEVLGLSDDDLVAYMVERLRSEKSWLRPQFEYMVQRGQLQVEAGARSTSRQIPDWSQEPILMLSGGGQWGAFGASYLKEVHTKTPGGLPDFGVVTGVSTGAMQSLFFGNWRDPEDRQQALERMYGAYKIADEREIVERGGLGAFATKGAMAQLGPLHQRIIDRICPPRDKKCPYVEAFLTKVSGAPRQPKHVLVGLVEATSGQFKYVSLNALVNHQYSYGDEEEKPHRAGQCLAGAVLASSAMPGYYQQLQVGDEKSGYRTYIDGGARASVFHVLIARAFSPAVMTQTMQQAYPAMLAQEASSSEPEATRPIYVVRNGPTSVVTLKPTKPSVAPGPAVKSDPAWTGLSAIQRAYAIMVNQSEVNSIAAIRLLQPKGDLFLATADGYATYKDGTVRCEKSNEEAMFDPAFMKCLFQLGKDKTTIVREDGSPWISVSEVDSGK